MRLRNEKKYKYLAIDEDKGVAQFVRKPKWSNNRKIWQGNNWEYLGIVELLSELVIGEFKPGQLYKIHPTYYELIEKQKG